MIRFLRVYPSTTLYGRCVTYYNYWTLLNRGFFFSRKIYELKRAALLSERTIGKCKFWQSIRN